MLKSGLGILTVLALASVLAAGCAGQANRAGTLLTHKNLDSYPAAELDATLVRESDCLYAVSDDQHKWVTLWPRGFSLSGDDVTKGGARVASVGETVKLGGGEYHESDYAFLRGLMTVDVPAACRGGDYWLIGEILP